MRETKDKRDQLKDRLKDVEEESERRRLAIEKLLLQALENGKEIEALKEIIFKRDSYRKIHIKDYLPEVVEGLNI